MLTNVNGRKLAYALTPQGINELYKRGKLFTSRTFALVNDYNKILCDVILQAKSSGKVCVKLYGESQIKFLIDYVCSQLNMSFFQCEEDTEIDVNSLCFIGEFTSDSVCEELKNKGCSSLIDLMQ